MSSLYDFNYDEGGNTLYLGTMGTFDSVNRKYPKLFDIYKELKKRDWSETDVPLAGSYRDLQSAPKSKYELMSKTLTWQLEGDSLISRADAVLFAPFVTNSEFSQGLAYIMQGECFTDDAEALTANGWKLIKDLQVNKDKIYSYDKDTKELRLSTVNNLVVKPYKGDLCVFEMKKLGHLYQAVTPNHRMLLVSTKTNKPEVFLAKDVNYHGNNKFVVSGFCDDSESEVLDIYEKLSVAYQADGNIDPKYNGNYSGKIPVSFGVKLKHKKDKLYRMKAEYEALGGEVRIYNLSDKDMLHMVFMIPTQYKNIFTKGFEWVTYDKSYTWYKSFVEELKNWDSCIRSENNFSYINTNEKAIEKVQTISHLIGNSALVTWQCAGKNRVPCGYVSIKKSDVKTGNSVKRTITKYDGLVCCPSVNEGFFLVRQKGKISVAGNCLHSLTYSEIIKQCYDSPLDIFYEIERNKQIQDRSGMIIETLEVLERVGAMYRLNKDYDIEIVKDAIFRGAVAIYCLEKISFMSSFAITFALGENQFCMEIARLVQKIFIDESWHALFRKEALTIMYEQEGHIWREVFARNAKWCKAFIQSVNEQEKVWGQYIFSEGRSIVGLNPSVLAKYTDFNTKEVYETCRLPVENNVTSNPLTYMDSWLDIDNIQLANQETQNTNYLLNSSVDDAGDEVIDFDF